MHVERERLAKQTAVCSVNDCGKIVYRNMLCRPHLNRQRAAKESRVCSVSGCSRKFLANGLCAVHDTRLRRYGDVNYTARYVGDGDDRETRFWSKTKFVGECREWQGSRDPEGYGQCGFIVDGQKHGRSHRVAFFLANGYFPEIVRHKCDNPPCCEPSHLIDGTQAQNIADKVNRGRQAKGSLVGNSVLAESEVQKIKQMQNDGIDRAEIIKSVGRSPSAVRHILDGDTWKHI